jgi:hypothetical protein
MCGSPANATGQIGLGMQVADRAVIPATTISATMLVAGVTIFTSP